MRLAGKTAIIHGGGGAIGGAVARAFARDGARVFLAGRTAAKLDLTAAAIGGDAEVAVVDALDQRAVDAHADAVAAKAGGIDIVMNAVGIHHVQGVVFAELSLDDYAWPITAYTRTLFITAQAAARHMVPRGRGVILSLSTPGSRLAGPGYMGYGVACAAKEAITRQLAGELGPQGIRAVCLMSHAIPETLAAGSHARDVFAPSAERAGMTVEAMVAGAAGATLLQRLPTLQQIADAAAFAASDEGAALTGTVLNLTCGAIVG
jgi:NAD(P)-dependent dehydrogenase (short-subunit alcohol dehydrogenase family)